MQTTCCASNLSKATRFFALAALSVVAFTLGTNVSVFAQATLTAGSAFTAEDHAVTASDSFAYTLPAGNNQVILVAVMKSTVGAPSSVVYELGGFSSITNQNIIGGNASLWVLSVGSGTPFPGNITVTHGSSPNDVVIAVATFENVEQTVPVTASNAKTAPASPDMVTVASATDDIAVDFIGWLSSSSPLTISSAPQTQLLTRQDVAFAGVNSVYAMSSLPGPGAPLSFTQTLTGGSPDAGAHLVVNLDGLCVPSGTPSINCPASASGDAGCSSSASVTFTVTGTDSCGNSLTPTCMADLGSGLEEVMSGDSFPLGMTTVMCSVTDSSGGMNNCSFVVTVTPSGSDTTAPTFDNCPNGSLFEELSSVNTCGAFVCFSEGAITATDDCDSSPSVTLEDQNGNTVDGDADGCHDFPVGTTIVTVTATDGSNNFATCSFTVEVTGAQDMSLSTDALNKISSTFGDGDAMAPGLSPQQANAQDFPWAVASWNHLGATVVAMGSRKEQAVWLVELCDDGVITAQSRFGLGSTAAIQGGFPTGALIAADYFGSSLAWLGDLDNNGTVELAVGVPGEDGNTANSNRGGFWIVSINFANAFDGNPATLPVTATDLITADSGDFAGLSLLNNGGFGSSMSAYFDGIGAGADWLAVGAPNRLTSPAGYTAGKVWLLDLSMDTATEVDAPDEGVYAAIQSKFGDAVAWMGDIDADSSTVELAVGAPQHRGALGGATQAGIVWVLSVDLTGPTVVSSVDIGGSTGRGGFPSGQLGQADYFGQSLAFLGDINGDNFFDLAVGAPADDDGGSNQGAVWILSLDPCDNTVASANGFNKINEAAVSFPTSPVNFGQLDGSDYFGWSLAPIAAPTGICAGDVQARCGGGTFDAGLLVGAIYDDDGASNRGAAWALNLSGDLAASNNK
jgi:hypothetical protein